MTPAQWPVPFDPKIDGPPTEEDADEFGDVQWMCKHGRWYCTFWGLVHQWKTPWQHTPIWKPKAEEEAEE